MSNKATQFKPGQSGNPKGAPKRDWTWSGEYQKAVEKKNLDGIPVKEGIAESLAGKALEGDVNAIKELVNRMDGMPLQSTDITSMGEKLGPSRIVIDTKPEE
jgi:hypothetical protein